jgi:hypothetical protein
MTPDHPPTLYRHHDAGAAAPSDDARWAITVQSGEDDPHPRVLAYARAEHVAGNICLALRVLDRTTLEGIPPAAAAYVAEKQSARVDPD